jgi:hypothetical protein
MWVWIDRKYAFICSGLVGPTGKKRCQFLLNGGGCAFSI